MDSREKAPTMGSNLGGFKARRHVFRSLVPVLTYAAALVIVPLGAALVLFILGSVASQEYGGWVLAFWMAAGLWGQSGDDTSKMTVPHSGACSCCGMAVDADATACPSCCAKWQRRASPVVLMAVMSVALGASVMILLSIWAAIDKAFIVCAVYEIIPPPTDTCIPYDGTFDALTAAANAVGCGCLVACWWRLRWEWSSFAWRQPWLRRA